MSEVEGMGDGLHEREYSLDILQNIVMMPCTHSNMDLLRECLISIKQTKRLTPYKAYLYMVRAIKLAKDQGVTVDYKFFSNAEYAQMRPSKGVASTVVCDAECKSRHGRGYHENDVKWVLRAYMKSIKAGSGKSPWDFFNELDSKRHGGPPEWRR